MTKKYIIAIKHGDIFSFNTKEDRKGVYKAFIC